MSNEMQNSESSQSQLDLDEIRDSLNRAHCWVLKALLSGDVWTRKELEKYESQVYDGDWCLDWVLMDLLAWGLVEELPKNKYRMLPKGYEVTGA